MLSQPAIYPDAITDWQIMKKEQRGAGQAIEDAALTAYHNAIDQGKTREEAEELYFQTFKQL